MALENKFRVLFDANILMDVLIQRKPHFIPSAAVWELAETNEIIGVVAAHSLTTIHYLYSRQKVSINADLAVRKIIQIFEVAAVDQNVIHTALGYQWNDFEDAVQMAAAELTKCDYLVTRNRQDFQPTRVSLIGPVELQALIGYSPKLN